MAPVAPRGQAPLTDRRTRIQLDPTVKALGVVSLLKTGIIGLFYLAAAVARGALSLFNKNVPLTVK